MSNVVKVEFGKLPKAAAPDSIDSDLGPISVIAKRRLEPTIFDFEWDPLVARIKVKGGSEYDDELDYTQGGRDKFGQIFIQTFGFHRLPRTWGELGALSDYCDALDSDARSGQGLELTAKYWPDQVPIMLAYLAGNRFELKRWHTEEMLSKITENWLAQ